MAVQAITMAFGTGGADHRAFKVPADCLLVGAARNTQWALSTSPTATFANLTNPVTSGFNTDPVQEEILFFDSVGYGEILQFPKIPLSADRTYFVSANGSGIVILYCDFQT